MTSLPNKETQLSWGWNTLERCLIGSAFNLFRLQELLTETVQTYAYKERVTVSNTINKERSIFTTEINFDLDTAVPSLLGQLGVKSFQNENYLDQLTEIPYPGDFVPVIPNEVETLESFFLWCAFKINRPENITLSPKYKEGTCLVTAVLPLDYDVLVNTQNDCLAASKRINTDLPDLA